ncbi:hypothetical protein LJ656_19815 [Paraburkholderia sp. MMS20-SJTR3]|uniref:Uncharacterized protein n=1 Tax=Paraburkholderia sejongensis TaxID=2886946 RepID=A0ABS8JYN2_9BURK|nr:hypothetical protein [Paraburkholderia sp. MMS20-SJTR3]MCC8394845.1 hypothetical protein [Paraburkholderia sp. MMS20-SJTR3]
MEGANAKNNLRKGKRRRRRIAGPLPLLYLKNDSKEPPSFISKKLLIIELVVFHAFRNPELPFHGT